MDRKKITEKLNTDKLGRQLELFDIINYSTNTRVRELLEGGAPDGVCVIADIQLQGRGRSGRVWSSGSPGESIAMSVALEADRSDGLAAVTLAGALAVRDAIVSFSQEPDRIGIKWPNDILVSGLKVCGILTELVSCAGSRRLIMGIGVNIAQKSFPPELEKQATSLALQGIGAGQEELAAEILNALERRYRTFRSCGFTALRDEYNGCLICKDEEIDIIDPSSVSRGICRGVNSAGEILLERGGVITGFSAGEVSVRGAFYGKK